MKNAATSIVAVPFRSLAVFVALGIAGALPIAGQSPERQPDEPPETPPSLDLVFGEQVDVRVVNMEVVVEDRRGRRVEGLRAEDFRILVDGREMAVDYFTEIVENRAVESGAEASPPAIGDGEVVPTNYLVFVDDDHTQVALRRPVLRRLAEQLPGLGLRDHVAVVVQSRRRLELLSPFTTDRDATRAALAELERGGGFGGIFRSRRLIDQAALPSSATAEEDLPFESMALPTAWEEVQADSLARDLEFSAAAVSSTMRALNVPHGRKVLMLLAGAWPVGAFRPQGQGIGIRTDAQILDNMIDTANILGYTVYPVDQQTRPSLLRWQNLKRIAQATGGRAYVAGANLTALGRIGEDVANYYWLGFVPDYRRDDRAHQVQVAVRDPALRVRSRRGYVDLSPRTEADMDTQRRLLFPNASLPLDEPSLLVDIGSAEKVGIRKMRVPVTVHIPVGQFPVLAWDDRFLARLELRFAVVDRNGQMARMPMIAVDLHSTTEPAPDEAVPYHTELTLRRRPHDLVVSVHDPLSDRTISLRTKVAFR